MGTLTQRAGAALAIAACAALLPARAGVAQAAATTATTATTVTTATASAASPDAALVAQIAARLARAKGVHARFTQTRTLAALKAPLVSTGSLLFFRERGVIWRIDAPYRKTWVMTDAGVVEIDAQGHRLARGAAGGARGAAEVARMMRALLGGDLSALYSQFDVDAHGTPARWQLRLVPRQPQLAQALGALQLDGGEFLQSLRITLANGDTIRYDFAASTAVTALAPADAALFGTAP